MTKNSKMIAPVLKGILFLVLGVVIYLGCRDNQSLPVTDPPIDFTTASESDANPAHPVTWWTSRDPATALLDVDLAPWGFFGLRVKTFRDGALLEDHQTDTIANHFQLLCSDPAHAVGWSSQKDLPDWIDKVEVTVYPWPEMHKAPSDREGATLVIRREE